MRADPDPQHWFLPQVPKNQFFWKKSVKEFLGKR